MTRTANYVAELTLQLRALGLPEPEPEYRFHPERRWRFDLAWPELKLALEVDGGTWVGGRHSTGVGAFRDSEKFSEAAILGWRILRVVPHMVRDGIAARYVERAVAATPAKRMIGRRSYPCANPACLTMIEEGSVCRFHRVGDPSDEPRAI